MLDDFIDLLSMDPFYSLGLLSSVAFFSRACAHGKVYIVYIIDNQTRTAKITMMTKPLTKLTFT